jgi:CRISPR-associated exonuclease Cas4
MQIIATHINYYHVCHRKLWLFAHGINMEHNSELVAEGKLIHETSYPQRAEKYTEIALEGAKIDFYDAQNKVVHEVKKTDKVEVAHIAQVKYYLYLLKSNGVDGAEGVIEYPKLRQKELVQLGEEDIPEIERWKNEIRKILAGKDCPPLVKMRICKKCSYYDFCYSGEE